MVDELIQEVLQEDFEDGAAGAAFGNHSPGVNVVRLPILRLSTLRAAYCPSRHFLQQVSTKLPLCAGSNVGPAH